MSEWLKYDTVKTRKVHACHECGVLVGKGESMVSGAWADGGEILPYRVCMDCESLRTMLVDKSFLEYLSLEESFNDLSDFDGAEQSDLDEFQRRCEASRERYRQKKLAEATRSLYRPEATP